MFYELQKNLTQADFCKYEHFYTHNAKILHLRLGNGNNICTVEFYTHKSTAYSQAYRNM